MITTPVRMCWEWHSLESHYEQPPMSSRTPPDLLNGYCPDTSRNRT